MNQKVLSEIKQLDRQMGELIFRTHKPNKNFFYKINEMKMKRYHLFIEWLELEKNTVNLS